MLNFFHDLRYGVRTLSKRPGFAATAITTLALGIGLNTTIFSLFNAAVLKQLPVRDASRVVDLYSRQPESNRLSVFSYPEFVFYRDNNTAFESVAAFAGTRVLLGNAASSGADSRPESDSRSARLRKLFRSSRHTRRARPHILARRR